MTFKRTNRGTSHSYYDDGQLIKGVTTLLGLGYPKPALVTWAARESAKYVVDRWDELLGMTPSERGRAVEYARNDENRKAIVRGKDVHAHGQALNEGQDTDVPPEYVGHVEAYAAWLHTFDVQPVYVESPVINRRHGYAGTLDLVADIAGERWLIDLKTGKGIYADTALQLAAYRYAEGLLLPDGTEVRMPEVDHCGIVHVATDGATFHLADVSQDTWRTFLYVAEVGRWRDVWDGYGPNAPSPISDPLKPAALPIGPLLAKVAVGQ